jgi:phosphoenolpyruvate carboxylase
MDPHAPLRDDVRLLGELLGDALKQHGGAQLYETVERVRGVAKNARGGDDAAFRELADELSRQPIEHALPVARAFAQFLSLANIAEQHHRIRRRREYQKDPASPPQRGSCEDAFKRLIDAGVTPDRLYDAVCRLRIELVITAHPTEIARRTVVQRYNRIAVALAANDRPDLTVPEREEVLATLRREVAGAWTTREVRDEQPSVLDEVRSGLVAFEQSLWTAVPSYLRAVDRALVRHTGRPLPLEARPITFGSWIGGDRDGNPNVTPDVTRVATLFGRWTAAHLLLREIDALREELSMYEAGPELRVLVGGASEPYRVLLRDVRRRLLATVEWIQAAITDPTARPDGNVYLSADGLSAAMHVCYRSLDETGNREIARGRLTDLIRRLAIFDFTLAPLDVRQESDRHAEAVAAVAQSAAAGRFTDWPDRQRVDFLTKALSEGVAPLPESLSDIPDLDDEVRDVLETCRTVARIPANSLGAYVITMASQASDVLAVEFLQRAAGVTQPLRVVPLFETSRDLQHAAAILDTLLTIPWYRARLAELGNRQEVMIGYSDSAKDVGRFAAGWDLHKAQETIVATCEAHGVRVTLFHGRGGSVGRGGGPTHLALMSQPPGSIDGTLRVTEQGEMIQALFGLPDIAQRTLEVYTTGTLEAWLTPASPPRAEWRAAMDRLAQDAREAYREVVHQDPQFLEYFRTATPEAELGSLNIGSRPARRKAGASLANLRAIPWQFAWTQTRLLLGAWLGVERALTDAMARGERGLLREMYRDWPHFRSSIELIEMVLAKTDERIAAEYDRRLVPEHLQTLGASLRERLRQAIAAVLDVTGHGELLESSPVIRRSIDVRNPYVDPINLVQIELLRRVRTSGDEEARRALMVTINGIAAGMRNTG